MHSSPCRIGTIIVSNSRGDGSDGRSVGRGGKKARSRRGDRLSSAVEWHPHDALASIFMCTPASARALALFAERDADGAAFDRILLPS